MERLQTAGPRSPEKTMRQIEHVADMINHSGLVAQELRIENGLGSDERYLAGPTAGVYKAGENGTDTVVLRKLGSEPGAATEISKSHVEWGGGDFKEGAMNQAVTISTGSGELSGTYSKRTIQEDQRVAGSDQPLGNTQEIRDAAAKILWTARKTRNGIEDKARQDVQAKQAMKAEVDAFLS